MTVEELNGKQAEELERQQALKNRIMCCTAAGCLSCGADGLRQAISAEITAQGRQAEIELCGSGCMGMCSRGPLVLNAADNCLYGNMEPADASFLVSANPKQTPPDRVNRSRFSILFETVAHRPRQ